MGEKAKVLLICSCTEDGFHLISLHIYSVDILGVSLKINLTHFSLQLMERKLAL